MNAVWNSYGQLCGCPEIFKKSCKFFCRELDIRVAKAVHLDRSRISRKIDDYLENAHKAQNAHV